MTSEYGRIHHIYPGNEQDGSQGSFDRAPTSKVVSRKKSGQIIKRQDEPLPAYRVIKYACRPNNGKNQPEFLANIAQIQHNFAFHFQPFVVGESNFGGEVAFLRSAGFQSSGGKLIPQNLGTGVENSRPISYLSFAISLR